jgi:hypothetical protein
VPVVVAVAVVAVVVFGGGSGNGDGDGDGDGDGGDGEGGCIPNVEATPALVGDFAKESQERGGENEKLGE